MSWPRGKNNLRRIGGFGVTVELNALDWRMRMSWRYFVGIHIGPLHIYITPSYESARSDDWLYELRSELK